MTKQTFGWCPDMGSQVKFKPNVNATKFGDGYELRSANAINSSPQNWSVTFHRSRQVIKEVLAFLEAMNGVESFIWKSPLERTGTYVCREWGVTMQKGTMELTCDFEQVFEF